MHVASPGLALEKRGAPIHACLANKTTKLVDGVEKRLDELRLMHQAPTTDVIDETLLGILGSTLNCSIALVSIYKVRGQ